MITYGMNRLFFSITLFCLVYASVGTTEYHSIHKDQLHLKYRRKRAEHTDVDIPCPKIKSQSIEIDVSEGKNVQFPCEVTESPQPYVWRNMESGLPELKWDIDNQSPILEYRLQIRRQQGPTNHWYNVKPNPRDVNLVYSDSKIYNYTISHVFGEKQEQYSYGNTYVPLSLQRNTIYEARIQVRADAYNNWSEWSPNVKFSVNEFTLLWKNGSETIMMNGGDSATKNTRVTQSKSPLSNTLSITNVTRWDSGTYTCKLTSECFVEVTHTLRVLHPPKILSLEVVGAKESTTAGGKVKKCIVKQGEPIQFICNVDGNPKPNVQWIKREKDQQMLLDSQSQVLDQSKASPQLPTLIVSNTSEFKIESANAQHDAGHYECIAQNKQSMDSPTKMELKLVIEYPPKILSLEVVGAKESTTAGGKVKKCIVKQGEPIQFICNVDGNPKPNVQWIKRKNDQQMLLDSQSQVLDQSKASPQQLPTLIVSNTSEFKIENTNAQRDAGHYDCIAKNKQSEGSQTNMELELVIEYPPTITVHQPVVHTGETFSALIKCAVNANPKANVIWEKEQTNANGSSTYVQLSSDDSTRYQTFISQDLIDQVSMPPISNYGLNVTLQSPKDLGKYRCKAENYLGHTYSDEVSLIVKPATPQHSYGYINKELPELRWIIDSLLLILEFQLQFKRQKDPPNLWYVVRPQPQVVNSSYSDFKFKYTVSYVFGESNKQEQSLDGSTYVPLSLQRNTTYVAHIRARNTHGWSEWSSNVEFSDNNFKRSNEINQNSVVVAINVSSAQIFYTLFIIIIIFIIVAVLYCIRLSIKSRNLMNNTTLDSIQSADIENLNPNLSLNKQANLLPYDEKWEFPREKLKIVKKLGSGAFGEVYKATATGITNTDTTTTVAVKMVLPTTDPLDEKALISELKIMQRLGSHVNVVNLLGACTNRIDKRLMVIVEYCSFGNTREFLLKHRNCFINQITLDGSINCDNQTTSEYENVIIITTFKLLNWSFQASRGMEYLSSKNIIHGDLAARNVLLTKDFIVKICDFGLAKHTYYRDIYILKSKKVLLPIKWMAIESIMYGVFSTKSDVWSFGILLWEIFSLAASPYPNIQTIDLCDKLVEGYRMCQPKFSNSEIYNIIRDCWHVEPKKRPSFNELSERLGNLLQKCTKHDYVEMHNDFEREENSRSTEIHCLLTQPDHTNCPATSYNHGNVLSNIHENLDSQDDFELRPIVNI